MKVGARCPCCNQRVKPTKILVSLDTNTIACAGRSVRLQPRLAEIAFVLAEHSPNTVAEQELMRRVYGRTVVGTNTLQTRLHDLRRYASAVGVSVVTVPKTGYRMVTA